ncbi:pyridoxamine 5'-phosphate oxidase family protein [Rhodanobacter denitrificans]|uniref:Pyridoxamine 5'-phosphate oxidase family protein n=1 Tax=Rhodanobacter denitrificans TaxID=666685 RepID=A0A368KF22_9GAMM|nr:pyridoxamine 5'-phosphate oxidase family protein [Rhodanobacter denitrificans]RCS29303.1 pyridoxamine 5'-phosphate oxidase family protein [Rhodanobacter denitrificans]
MSKLSTDCDINFPRTDRSRIRREPHLGSYLRSDVYAVVDASPLCHIGYVIDGAPFVTPTMHWRKDNRIYWHGSIGSRFLKQVDGAPACVTCSLVDGYVLARSALNHAVNYRSAMMFGTANVMEDLDDRAEALRDFMEGLFPGRWDTLRPVMEKELRATSVLWMDIEEATVKARTGPPSDADESHVPVWAGVIPMQTMLAEGQPAPEASASTRLPDPLAALIASGRLR